MQSTSTALILRDPHLPEIHILECDGPSGFASVNRYPGEFGKNFLSFEEFTALPDYAKFPGPSLHKLEHNNARRCYRILENAGQAGGRISHPHLRELRGRLKLMSPFCDEDY